MCERAAASGMAESGPNAVCIAKNGEGGGILTETAPLCFRSGLATTVALSGARRQGTRSSSYRAIAAAALFELSARRAVPLMRFHLVRRGAQILPRSFSKEINGNFKLFLNKKLLRKFYMIL